MRVSELAGDVDGDGRSDRVQVYGEGSDEAPGPWQVAVDLAANGRRAATITDADFDDPTQRVRVLGVAGLGGEPVVFVVVGVGASASVVGFFQLVGCELVRVLTPAQSAASYAVGATVTHLDGLRCTARGLEILSAESADGVAYSATTTPAVLAHGTITLGPGTTAEATPADLMAYGSLSCPGVEPL
ncbi:MAG: hypothetical protein ACR2LQ_02825 [Acidimicrobiales bacterium]